MAFTYRHGDRPLNGYTIQRGVGRGGFGEVYYAVSDGGREVALKYLRDNPAVELRGVSACMNLKSPHLVEVFDIKQNQDGEYFIVMEYIDGPSLRDILIAEPNGLGPQKAAFLIRELAKGLGYLHDRGIVHRDVKPGNVFYEDGYVKIGDYGLSKFISISRHSAQTSSVGTVHYMAPEVGSGNYHRGIDIYALGVMLYEMLLGRVPYEGSSMGEVLMKHLTAQPAVDHLPKPFGDVIRKALAKDPNDRYQSVGEMAEELLSVDQIRESLAGFDAMSLTVAVHPAPAQPALPPRMPVAPRPQGPPVTAPIHPRGGAVGIPYGRPAGQALQLSPEAAAGNLRYAGFWIRFCATLIDMVIMGLIGSLLRAEGLVDGAVFIVYQGLLVGLWNGQTLGKRACGIKVIGADGRPCTVGRAFGRAFARIISMLTLMIGFVMAAFDFQKRALHDRIAGTLHVYALE